MMLDFATLDELELSGKRVFLRVDYNVPLQDGKVGDKTRIEATLPTIKELQKKGAKIALFSHLGRPKGRDPEWSLQPLCEVLASYLPSTRIVFRGGDYCASPNAFWQDVSEGDIILAENLRYYEGEEENDPLFARQLSKLADVMINDAFATCHRAHASIVGITQFMPCAAGKLLESELTSLYHHYIHGKPPFMAMIGGAKISSKIEVLQKLLSKISILAIGGGMANTFLLAQGFAIGKSLVEPSQVTIASDIIQACKKAQKKIILPKDVVVAKQLAPNVNTWIRNIQDLEEDDRILDIGPESLKELKEALSQSKTLLWNGPLGAFEVKPFDEGTKQFALYAAELTKQNKITSITGGGDSVAAITELGLEKDFSYVSTGGGAFLEWLEGRVLPGLDVLFRKNPASRSVIF